MVPTLPPQKVFLLQGVFNSAAYDELKKKNVGEAFILEGRPGLEAARISSHELTRRNIKATLISDNMAGFLFYKNFVREVWVSYQSSGPDGILCQIGGLILGVLAKKHRISVSAYPNGKDLRLMGKSKELIFFNGIKVAPKGIAGYVPLAEWVPSKYITKVYHG